MNLNTYKSLNDKVYGYFLHQYSTKKPIPVGQIKYHFKNFQKYFKFSKKQFKNKEVLDTGCGPGIHSVILALLGCKVTAIDFSKKNISRVKKLKKIYKIKNLDAITQDLSKPIKDKNKKFDLISIHNWIQHTPDPYLILKNLIKSLKIGGKVYISCYQDSVFRCNIAYIARSILKSKDFNIMRSLCLNMFPSGFKKYQNYNHAQFALMFDDFFTPYLKVISYKKLNSDFESLGLKLITKIPEEKNIFLKHMPYVRMGFIKEKNNFKKSYKPFYSEKAEVSLYKHKNIKILRTNTDLIKKIIKKFKKASVGQNQKIIFCASLFELSCQFSLDSSAKKYMVLNSFLDRVLNENYEYFSPKNLMSKNRKIFDF